MAAFLFMRPAWAHRLGVKVPAVLVGAKLTWWATTRYDDLNSAIGPA